MSASVNGKDISAAAAVPQVPTKVFTVSLSSDKEPFRVVVQLLSGLSQEEEELSLSD